MGGTRAAWFIGASMKIDFTTILYIGVLFFLAVWFCKIVVKRARESFARDNNDIDSVKAALHALNIKTNALQIEFDVLKTEMIALKIKTQPAKYAQNSPTPMLNDAHAIVEDTWTRDTRVSEASIAPMMPPSAFDDIWPRDVVGKEFVEGDAITGRKKKSVRLRVEGNAINDNEIVMSSRSK